MDRINVIDAKKYKQMIINGAPEGGEPNQKSSGWGFRATSLDNYSRQLEFWSRKVFEGIHYHMLDLLRTCSFDLQSLRFEQFESRPKFTCHQFYRPPILHVAINLSPKWTKVADSDNGKMDQSCNLTREFLITCQIAILGQNFWSPSKLFQSATFRIKWTKVPFPK